MCKELKLVLGGGPGQTKANAMEKDKKATDEKTVKKEEVDKFITVNGYRYCIRYYRSNFRGKERDMAMKDITKVAELRNLTNVQLNFEKTEKTRMER